MKFLRENADYSNVSLLTEATSDGKKELYIEGIFAQAEKKNRNGRIYPKTVMEGALNPYVTNYVAKNRALGELSHPENRPQVKPELASHRIVSLKMEGDDVIGKALVLNTPQGNILRGLLEGGTQMGVSTRGLGSVSERANASYVGSDYVISAIDAVIDPSALDAWVSAVNESQEWLVTDDGQILEKTQQEIKKVQQVKLTEEKMLQIMESFFKSIRAK